MAIIVEDCSAPKAPLAARGAVSRRLTEGIETIVYIELPAVNPSASLSTSPKVNCRYAAREGGLGHYTGEALVQCRDAEYPQSPQKSC